MASENIVRLFAVGALAALVAGCNSSGVGGLNIGQGGSGGQQGGGVDQATGSKVVQGTCPKIELREGTAYFRKYARGGEDDPSKILYQAAIADTTRQCSVTGDQMTIQVVAAGRAAAGPAGKAGTIKMPIRVAVVEKGTNKVIYSELSQFETTLPPGTPTTQFLFTDPKVNIPITASRSVRIFVGFDEGPYRGID